MTTVTPFADMSPSPRMDVLLGAGEVLAGAVTATVLQISSAGQQPVREADRAPVSGGLFVTDFEPPIGIEVSYRVEQFNAAGASLGITDAVGAQVEIPRGMVVIQDPLAPRNAVMIPAEATFANELNRSRDVQLYRRGVDTIALMGEVGLYEAVPLTVVTRTDEETAALREILAEGDVLVRSMPSMPLPRLLYVVVDAEVTVPHDARAGGEHVVWPLKGDQVSRPEFDIVGGVVTYAQFNAAFATYAAAKAVYATYLDAKRNPPPEV